MEIKIVDKQALSVVGITLKTSFSNDRNKSEIPPFFHKILKEGRLDDVPGRLNLNQLCVFEMKKGVPDFNYTMGVEVMENSIVPTGMNKLYLPASLYVSVRTVKRGPEDVGKAFGFIYKEYIPNSIYVPTGAPSFIYYDKEFFDVFNARGYDGNPMATIYVPVKALFIKRLFSFFKS